MREDEIVAVAALWRRSRTDALPSLERRVPRPVADDVGRVEHLARTGEMWVAVASVEAVVGMLALVHGQVDLLYVEPVEQGRGVGSVLLDHAKTVSPSGLTLFTHQRNEHARRFYEDRGFRVVRFGISPPPESEPDVLYEWTPSDVT